MTKSTGITTAPVKIQQARRQYQTAYLMKSKTLTIPILMHVSDFVNDYSQLFVKYFAKSWYAAFMKAKAKRGRPSIPTPCTRCGRVLKSAREAFMHCRNGKPGRPRNS